MVVWVQSRQTPRAHDFPSTATSNGSAMHPGESEVSEPHKPSQTLISPTYHSALPGPPMPGVTALHPPNPPINSDTEATPFQPISHVSHPLLSFHHTRPTDLGERRSSHAVSPEPPSPRAPTPPPRRVFFFSLGSSPCSATRQTQEQQPSISMGFDALVLGAGGV